MTNVLTFVNLMVLKTSIESNGIKMEKARKIKVNEKMILCPKIQQKKIRNVIINIIVTP